MSQQNWSEFAHYLAAKRTVDDRALNRFVHQTARENLPATRPLRVLEVGAGIGTMLTRLLAWDFLPEEVEYTAVDADPALETIAVAHWRAWTHAHGYAFHTTDTGYLLESNHRRVRIAWRAADALAFAEQAYPDWHLLLGHAFLDLVHLPAVLPALLRLIPGGLFLFTLNYDGVTIFEPPVAEDDRVLSAYHRTMDERRVNGAPAGESTTGRRLLRLLPQLGAHILAAGSSDWVVYPQNGVYPADEAAFLRTILNFVESSLQCREDVDAETLHRWLQRRGGQIAAGELVYIAHQLDITGFSP